MHPSTDQLSYTLAQASLTTGLSQTFLSQAIHAGQLHAKRSSRDDFGDPQGKYVILRADLEAYLESLPDA